MVKAVNVLVTSAGTSVSDPDSIPFSANEADECMMLHPEAARMLATQLRAPDSPKNAIGGYIAFENGLDMDAFIATLEWFWIRSDAERMAMALTGNGWRFRFHADADMPPPQQIDLPDSTQAIAWMRAQMAIPIALTTFPLFEHAIVSVGDGRRYYFARHHHLLADGFSFSLKIATILRRYAMLLGHDVTVPETLGSCREQIGRIHDYLDSDERAEDLAYWRDRLRGAQTTRWPSARPTTDGLAMEPIDGAELSIGDDLHRRMGNFVSAQGVSPLHLLLVATASTLARLTGQNDVTLGVPIHNRANRREKMTSGGFSTIMPTRVQLDSAAMNDVAAVRAVAIALGQDLVHRRLPLWDMVKQYRQDHPADARLFDTIVNYERFEPVPLADALGVSVRELSSGFEHVPLRINYGDFRGVQPDVLRVELKAGFHPDGASALAAALLKQIDAIVDVPDNLAGEPNRETRRMEQ